MGDAHDAPVSDRRELARPRPRALEQSRHARGSIWWRRRRCALVARDALQDRLRLQGLAVLARAQGLLDSNMSPADRVTPELVAAYIAEIRTNLAPYTVLCRVQEIYDAVRVMAPKTNFKWLTRVHQSLKAQVRPSRDKHSRVKPPQALIALGERLMDQAEAAARWSKRRRAVVFRDGLLIAMLAYRPVRRKNLAMMRLGRHLIKVGGRWRIAFSAEEMKTRVPYEAIFPAAARPEAGTISRRASACPPAGRAEGRQSRSSAGSSGPRRALGLATRNPVSRRRSGFQIYVQTRREFGRGLFPHMFRDCVATAVAIDKPKHIGDASLILGHADHRTTEKHYNHARSLGASRRHAATLARLGESLRINRTN